MWEPSEAEVKNFEDWTPEEVEEYNRKFEEAYEEYLKNPNTL